MPEGRHQSIFGPTTLERIPLIFFAKVVITVGLLYIVVTRADPRAVVVYWYTLSPLVLITPLILILQTVVAACRWHLILRTLGEAPRLRISIIIFWSGIFLNSFLPAGLASDGIRILGSRSAGAGLKSAVNSVLLDRLIGVFGMILVAGAAAPAFARLSGDSSLLYAIPIIAACMVLGTASLTFLDRLLATRQQSRIARLGIQLARDIGTFFRSPAAATWALGAAAFSSVAQSLAVYVIARSLSLDIAFVDCLIIVPPVTLLAGLPLSIGGWGIREGTMVTLFGMIGISPAAALSLSLIFGAVTLLASLPGALAWLFVRRLR
jgi:glycosyltransferase 2 family protein